MSTSRRPLQLAGARARFGSRPSFERVGWTMLEVLAVAALLVILSSVVVPAMTNMGRRGTLVQSAGDVGRFVAESRRTAIDSGVRRWVRYESEGTLLIAGDEGAEVDAELVLPEGCEFAAHDSPESLPEVVADSVASEKRSSAFSPELALYPDGTASDGFITLTDRGRSRSIVVRGLTGGIAVVSGGIE